MIALELLHTALNASTAIAQTYLSSIQGHGLYRTARLPRKRPHKPMSKSGSAVEAGRGGLRLAVWGQSRPRGGGFPVGGGSWLQAAGFGAPGREERGPLFASLAPGPRPFLWR